MTAYLGGNEELGNTREQVDLRWWVEITIGVVTGYTVLWTLVPVRTTFYGAVWFGIWWIGNPKMNDIRIPLAAILQALFYRHFSSIVAWIAACVILITTSSTTHQKAAVLKIYPQIILCTYANLVLGN
jgi:hypothetical protein